MGRSLKLVAVFAYATFQLLVQRPATHRQRAEWLHRFCLRAVRRMDIAVRCHGAFPQRGVVIANHLGYLDIVAFAALSPCAFIGKSEIRKWPFLGWITAMGGTVYVQRGRGGSAGRARSEIKSVSDAAIPLVVFPEGTCTCGDTVLPFHSGILSEAIRAGQPITAAYLRYRLTRSNAPNRSLANVCFWDDTPLLMHIFRMLAMRGIEVHIRFAEFPIAFSVGADQRKLAAQEAQAAVMELRDADQAGPVAHRASALLQ
jgi:1-acyl-sn-glycerol-3-phosphate acyltransferase